MAQVMKTSGMAALGGAVLLGSTFLSTAASAQSIDELKARIEALTEKVEAMESQSQQNVATPVIAPAQAVTAGDFPGAIKLPGTNTSFKIGGYVKADAQFSSTQGLGDSFSVAAIPFDGSSADNPDGPFRIHARQTRINFQTRTPSEFGMVRTYIEGDFFGAGGNETLSNSSTFRIRHAYGTIGNFLAGQTWSTFMHLGALADTIDFFGPQSVIFVRQGQLRYTIPFGNGFKADLSVENPQSIVTGSANGIVSFQGGAGSNADKIPDFVGKLTYSGNWGFVSVAGLVGALDIDDGTTANANNAGAPIDDTEVLWAVHLGGRINTFGKDSIAATGVIGEGFARYHLGPAIGFMGFVDQAGNVEAVDQWGFQVNYEHWWTDNLYSTVAFGWAETQRPRFLGTGFAAFAAAPERTQSLHANIQWVPVPNVVLGIEGIVGWVNFDNLPAGADDDNNAWRVHFGAKWSF